MTCIICDDDKPKDKASSDKFPICETCVDEKVAENEVVSESPPETGQRPRSKA
jgi:hypothetical protein